MSIGGGIQSLPMCGPKLQRAGLGSGVVSILIFLIFCSLISLVPPVGQPTLEAGRQGGLIDAVLEYYIPEMQGRVEKN